MDLHAGLTLCFNLHDIALEDELMNALLENFNNFNCFNIYSVFDNALNIGEDAGCSERGSEYRSGSLKHFLVYNNII